MTELQLIDKLKSRLIEISGCENVSSDDFILISYSEDASPYEGKKPRIVVRPETTDQVSEIVKLAYETETPIVPVGGRSSISGSTIPRVDNTIMIDITKMSNILEINEDMMTVTVQTGITWSGLIHQLKQKGYKLGFRGPYGGNAGTVGGSLSGNSIGCGAAAHGGVCDNVISLEVILSDGEIIKTGSNWRNTSSKMKCTFARYCTFNDNTGIFLGDHGTLGIKTAATLKIFHLAKGIEFSDFGFSNLDQAVKAFHEIQSNHMVEEMVMLGDKNSIELLASSYLSTFKSINLECIIAVIIEEPDERLAKIKKELCEKIARKFGGKSIGQFLSKAHWLNMFNLTQSLFEEGFWYNTCHIRPINSLPTTIDKFHEIANKYKFKENGFNWIISALGVDHCFSSGWLTIFMGDRTKEEILQKAWHELREMEIELGGVPYWTGKLWEPYALKIVDPTFINAMKRIKKALDPKNIIHPTVFGL